jgi:hypothetical protein
MWCVGSQLWAARNTSALATPVDTMCTRYGVWQHLYDEQQQQQQQRARRLAARLRPVLRAARGVAAHTLAMRARLAATHTTVAVVQVCTILSAVMSSTASLLDEWAQGVRPQADRVEAKCNDWTIQWAWCSPLGEDCGRHGLEVRRSAVNLVAPPIVLSPPQARLQLQTGVAPAASVPSLQRLRNRVAEDELLVMQESHPFAALPDRI